MQTEAYLKVQEGSRGCGHGSTGVINFVKDYGVLLGKPVPFHLETIKRQVKMKKKGGEGRWAAETIPYVEK